MAASHPAFITEEGDEKLVHLPASVPLKAGPVGYQIEPSGKLVLIQLPEEERARRQAAWIAFLDEIESRPPDPEFMMERPMNVPPLDRNLFPDD
jgi:hypothetical protein